MTIAQRGFKSKTLTSIRMATNLFQHQSSRLEGGTILRERCQTGGNKVGIYGIRAVRLIVQKLTGKGRFACSVGSGDDYNFSFGCDYYRLNTSRISAPPILEAFSFPRAETVKVFVFLEAVG